MALVTEIQTATARRQIRQTRIGAEMGLELVLRRNHARSPCRELCRRPPQVRHRGAFIGGEASPLNAQKGR